MNLTTPEAVKRLMVGDSGNLDADALAQIGFLIGSISARAATYCNRDFEAVERVEYLDGGGRYLYLACPPVREIKEVLYSFTWDWATASIYGPADYALVDAVAGMIGFRGSYWPEGDKAMRVTYTGGYDLPPAEGEDPPEGYTPIPADLEAAICKQAVYEFRRREDLGLRAVSLPDGSINKMEVEEWLTEVKDTLDRGYRIRP